MPPLIQSGIHQRLHQGLVIPACPLALTARRQLDERRQRALVRYYSAAGAGGLAVGVHTTQFAIRNPGVELLKPVLQLVAEELDRADARRTEPFVRIAGVCGRTEQAVREARLAAELGYHAGLLSLGAWKSATEVEIIEHCRAVAGVIPLFGFFLQPAAGGLVLPHSFWRRLAGLENLVALKIAPFNRYQTLDVIRAVAESGREDVALYTGNDDNIVLDLLTPFRFQAGHHKVTRRIVGGLLGHWAVWTRRAVELHDRCRNLAQSGTAVPLDLLRLSMEVTDANAAIFDAAHQYAGCLPGIHEVLRRQGLLEGIWCLDPGETLSSGQAAEIDRVCQAYPHLTDDAFINEHLEEWLSG